MSDLEDYIDKDQKERQEREEMIQKAGKFLVDNGYEVHPKGQLCKTGVDASREARYTKNKQHWYNRYTSEWIMKYGLQKERH